MHRHTYFPVSFLSVTRNCSFVLEGQEGSTTAETEAVDDASSYTCWIVGNGALGAENQAVGLCQQIGIKNFEMKRPVFRYCFDSIPTRWALALDATWPLMVENFEVFAPPYPDIIVGSGRSTAAGGKPFFFSRCCSLSFFQSKKLKKMLVGEHPAGCRPELPFFSPIFPILLFSAKFLYPPSKCSVRSREEGKRRNHIRNPDSTSASYLGSL